VARDLKHFIGHVPKVWKTVRQALARQDAAALLAAVGGVPVEEIAPQQRKDWEEYRQFLKRHQRHLEDYRKVLQAAGVDTSGMRPMGSAGSPREEDQKRFQGKGSF
jgi:transcription initiation factor TFIID subunit TAF12